MGYVPLRAGRQRALRSVHVQVRRRVWCRSGATPIAGIAYAATTTCSLRCESYVHNLNSHWAYEDFRDRRAQLRRAGRPIDGYDLAGELVQYSERRAAYVQAIRRVMRQNRLDDFDGAWLNNRKWTALIGLPSEQPI